jgi:hypothetical protein
VVVEARFDRLHQASPLIPATLRHLDLQKGRQALDYALGVVEELVVKQQQSFAALRLDKGACRVLQPQVAPVAD